MSPDQKLGISVGVPKLIETVSSELILPLDFPSWARDLQEIGYLPERVVIADPLSYCAGVVRADVGMEEMFKEFPDGFYLYHAPIHSETKLKEWEGRGAVLIETKEQLLRLPQNLAVYISAHSIGPDVWEILEALGAKGKDSSCPLVSKTHREVEVLVLDDYTVLLVGYKDHDEIQGTYAIAPDRIKVIHPKIVREELDLILDSLENIPKIGLRSQTTLDYENLSGLIGYIQERRPDLNLPKTEDICYATHNRQEAVIAAISRSGAELMIIFGSDETKSQPSSNTIRLREVSNNNGAKRSRIVEDISEIESGWFNGISVVGVSAGASAPPIRVSEFLMTLKQIG